MLSMDDLKQTIGPFTEESHMLLALTEGDVSVGVGFKVLPREPLEIVEVAATMSGLLVEAEPDPILGVAMLTRGTAVNLGTGYRSQCYAISRFEGDSHQSAVGMIDEDGTVTWMDSDNEEGTAHDLVVLVWETVQARRSGE